MCDRIKNLKANVIDGSTFAWKVVNVGEWRVAKLNQSRQSSFGVNVVVAMFM